MLAHEWRELEVLCERISNLRHRYAAALKTKNAGLLQGLRDDMALARRHRELLVHHISARLGTVAAERAQPQTAAAQRAAIPTASVRNGTDGNGRVPADATAEFVGFDED